MDGYFTKGISNLFTDLGKYLSSLGFANGNVNDKALAFLKDRTGDTGSINNLSYDFMVNEGIPAGNIQDMFSKWLSLKVTTGSNAVNDKIRRLNALPIPLLFMPFIDDLSLALGSGSATFTRSTTGTFIDKDDGLLKTAAINTARFESEGVLIEGASTNTLLRSEEFDNASWVKTEVSVTGDDTIAPDGSGNADKIVQSSSSSFHFISQAVLLPFSTIHTYSFYAKAGETTSIGIQLNPNGNWVGISNPKLKADLSNCTIESSSDIIGATISDVGNGWCRISITQSTESSGAGNSSINIYHNDVVSFTGDGSSGYFLWGAQLEELPFASSYIATTSTAVTRTADNLSIDQDNIPASGSPYSLSLAWDSLGSDPTNRKALWDTSETQRIGFIETDDTIHFESGGSFEGVNSAPVTVTDTHKFVGTSTGLLIELFDDKISQGTMATTAITGSVTKLTIGKQSNDVRYLFGHIKDFRIDNIVLTVAQVEVL